MSWLLLAALGAVWAVLLLPGRGGRPNRSVEEFERNMELLADTEQNGQGRWIVTPRKGVAFVGRRERARERARERRRRVLVVVLESIGLTFLIGLVPPLRAMWFATGALLALLGLYVWLLVSIKGPSTPKVAAPAGPLVASNGHASRRGDDLVDVVVKPAGRVEAARV